MLAVRLHRKPFALQPRVKTALENVERRVQRLQNNWSGIDTGEEYARTMCFSVFIVFQLFNVMNCRSNENSVFKLGLFSNRAIYLAIAFSTILLLIAVQGAEWTIPFTTFQIGELLSTTPLEQSDWFIVFFVASTVFMIEEFRKLLRSTGIFRVRTSRRA